MSAVTDHNIAQAALLITALREQLGEMIPKLARATPAHTSRAARALRRDAVKLRCDVGKAQFLIAQLQRRFPGADTARVAAESRHDANEASPSPVSDRIHVSAVVG